MSKSMKKRIYIQSGGSVLQAPSTTTVSAAVSAVTTVNIALPKAETAVDSKKS